MSKTQKEYTYLKIGDIQQEGDQYRHKGEWIVVTNNYIGKENIGFFEIRREIVPKVENEPITKTIFKTNKKRKWWQGKRLI